MTSSMSRLLRTEVGPTVVATVWILLAQAVCYALWDAGVLSRVAGLVHWLVVGVLPAALALPGPARRHR